MPLCVASTYSNRSMKIENLITSEVRGYVAKQSEKNATLGTRILTLFENNSRKARLLFEITKSSKFHNFIDTTGLQIIWSLVHASPLNYHTVSLTRRAIFSLVRSSKLLVHIHQIISPWKQIFL